MARRPTQTIACFPGSFSRHSTTESLAPIVLFFGRVAQVVVQVATIRVLTTLVLPEEVGRYYLLLSVQGWISLALISAPSMYVGRNFLEWQRRGLHAASLVGLTLYIFAVGLLSAGIVSLVLIMGLISSSASVFTVLVVVGWLVVVTVVSQSASLLNLTDCRLQSVWVLLGASIFGLIVASVAATLFRGEAEAWLCGSLIGQGIVGVAGAMLVVKGNKLGAGSVAEGVRQLRELSRGQVEQAWSFMWPVALITALYWAQTQGYRIPLALSLDEKAVGLFAVAYSMGATIMIVVESVLHQWMLPSFYQRIIGMKTEQIDAIWQEYVALLVGFILPVSTFAVFVGPFMLKLFAGAAFQVAAGYAIWGGIAESIRAIAGLFYLGGIGRRETREMLLPHLPGALLAPFGAYVFSRFWSLHGAGVAVAVSYAVLVAMMWSLVQRELMSKVQLEDLRVAISSAVIIGAFLVSALVLGWRESYLLSGVTIVVAIACLGIVIAVQIRNVLRKMGPA